jgi:hypothetical protein
VLLGYGFSFVHDKCETVFVYHSEGPVYYGCEDYPGWTSICTPFFNSADNTCVVTCSRGVYLPLAGVDAHGNFLNYTRYEGPSFGDDCASTCDDYDYHNSYACGYSYEGGYGSMCCTMGQAPGDPLPDCPSGQAYYNGASVCSCPPDSEYECTFINSVAGKVLKEYHASDCSCHCLNDTVTDIWLDQDCENDVGGYCWKASYYNYDTETGYNGSFNPEYGKLWWYNPPEGEGCPPNCPTDYQYIIKPPYVLHTKRTPNIWDILVPPVYAQLEYELVFSWEDYAQWDYDLIQDISSGLGGCGHWSNIGVIHVDSSYLYEFHFWSGCNLIYITKTIMPYCLGGCGGDWDNSKINQIHDALYETFPFSLLNYAQDFLSQLEGLSAPAILTVPLPFYGDVEFPAPDLTWFRVGLFVLLVFLIVVKLLKFLL